MVNRAVLTYAIVVASLGCAGGDYQISLPHGYFISRVKPGDFALIAPNGHTVAVRTVKSYMVHEALVVGQTVPSANGQPLYFIVNTQTNSIRLNLTGSQWKRELERLGVQAIVLEQPKPAHAVSRWFTK